MSKKSGVDEEEEEDVESFHDSLDRLVSSTNTSCSCSGASSSSSSDNDDEDPVLNSNSGSSSTSPTPIPKFPMNVSNNYDVWISQPFSSIEERRLRLLSQMGLSRDPSLLRHRSSLSFSSSSAVTYPPEIFTRSVSSDRLNNPNGETRKTNSPDNHKPIQIDNYELEIVRSKFDGECISSSFNGVNNENQIHNNDNVNRLANENVNGSSPNKPPRVKFRSNGSGLSFSGNPEVEEVVEVAVEGEDPVCLIKDLDNGKEFVVEDGIWEGLKEVGTGRQLTMEEFDMCVGTSPIVQELMRRQNVEEQSTVNRKSTDTNSEENSGPGTKQKKKGNWLKSIKNTVIGYKEKRSSDEKDTSSEKGGRRSSSATDDSQDVSVSFHGPERVRVRQYGKPVKELTALYKRQEIQGHNGSIWTIKFSLDGKYLASAGEDCVIHIWKVLDLETKGDLLFEDLNLGNGSPELSSLSTVSVSPSFEDKRRKSRSSISRKSISLDNIKVPETLFGLTDLPFCSFEGHLDDVLDLSWSKSQHLLSSSMDKTVRLWHLSSKSCLKIFSHSDYVTCIQFNPVDDRYFISGSLDAKVRIWSIPDRQVVDWNDLHEMVTAACYTPDGQGAIVGSYKGTCRLYNTSENKLQQKDPINLQNKKKKSHKKKITGFQFVPGSTSEVLITSADSRIRVVDGIDLVHKFKGFRNTKSQISASVTSEGKYVICASEDSYVYIWKHEGDSRPSRSKNITITRSYEHFHCQDVSVAIPWPGKIDYYSSSSGTHENSSSILSTTNHPPTPNEDNNGISPLHGILSSASNSYIIDRFSFTWPEEKGLKKSISPRISVEDSSINGKSALGMVIVTAGIRGEIRVFQNFGHPVRI